jgi:hypothetical protein
MAALRPQAARVLSTYRNRNTWLLIPKPTPTYSVPNRGTVSIGQSSLRHLMHSRRVRRLLLACKSSSDYRGDFGD